MAKDLHLDDDAIRFAKDYFSCACCVNLGFSKETGIFNCKLKDGVKTFMPDFSRVKDCGDWSYDKDSIDVDDLMLYMMREMAESRG